ncbi:hypothetical protein KY285_005567 [Solanum tuberosum]|nr:hypothetical protein KY284_005722 [Solanum tuberosum]KAH0752419.1 hypothetical protein KY285_005567 [Solanum tuberosum]
MNMTRLTMILVALLNKSLTSRWCYHSKDVNLSENSLHLYKLASCYFLYLPLLPRSYTSGAYVTVSSLGRLPCVDEGANITVNSVHPGVLRAFTCLLWKNVPQGAATTCYIALHPSLKGVTGKYFSDRNEYKPSKLARNEVLAQNLWDFSNNLVNASQNIIDK